MIGVYAWNEGLTAPECSAAYEAAAHLRNGLTPPPVEPRILDAARRLAAEWEEEGE